MTTLRARASLAPVSDTYRAINASSVIIVPRKSHRAPMRRDDNDYGRHNLPRQCLFVGVSTHATGNYECFARDPFGVGRCEKNGCSRDILRLTDATERRLRFDALLHVTSSNAGGVDAFGLDHAGINRVDANFAGSQFFRERARQRIDRPFGAAVNSSLGNAHLRDYGTDVDNASAGGTEQLRGGLRREQQAENVEVELLVEVFFG